jgi:hypothetical protein
LGLATFKILSTKNGGAPVHLHQIGTIGHEATTFGELGSPRDARQSMSSRKLSDLHPSTIKGTVGEHDDRPRSTLNRCREGALELADVSQFEGSNEES